MGFFSLKKYLQIVFNCTTVVFSTQKKDMLMKKNMLPKLSVAQQEDLLNTPNNQMVVYNHLTGELNQKKYAGRPVFWLDSNFTSGLAKARLDHLLGRDNRQVVASVAKGIPEMAWNGVNEFVQYPLADECSDKIAANVIVFNMKTGLYEVLPAGQWLGVKNVQISSRHHTGLHSFLLDLHRNEAACKKIVDEFAKVRQK